MSFELKFDPKTIEHLGVKMYSTIPPALAELISNSYDADASHVEIKFHEQNKEPRSITVVDDGHGMSKEDIQNNFLVIGRNRREKLGDLPSPKFGRLPTGKKGLGKLALFGLAGSITIDTVKNKLRNRFKLDWNDLLSADGVYKPLIDIDNQVTHKGDGTTIKLSQLKRKSQFNIESLADSLSKIFIIETNFSITLSPTNGESLSISNERRYGVIEHEFIWDKSNINFTDHFLSKIEFQFITSSKPIPPNSGLRGVTIFSRGKMVNAPEYFTASTSSHFYQYLTGWIKADFIDALDEDVISTNRQSINWDNDEMAKFRNFLSDLIMHVSSMWRKQRSDVKEVKIKEQTGIDKKKWMSTLPKEIQDSANKIISTLEKEEGVDESFAPIVRALYEIIPEYPELHWRHLHESLRDRVKSYYVNEQFAEAADQATKVYGQLLRNISGTNKDGTELANLFSTGNKQTPSTPKIQVANINCESGWNIQEGQAHLTRGVMAGFRNPLAHEPLDSLVPTTFTQLDCLNILSLISYLTARLDYCGQVENKKDTANA